MTQPRMVGDRYELGELIGYGGMAEVHRGRDTRLNRDVAIKLLRADLARDPAFLNRFRREAHSAAGLNHPSIVSVYDTGEDHAADGTAQPFIVMEYVQGRTLRDIVKSEGSLPARRAMEVTAEICGALDFSHRNGIIHRDIKPANVMITPQGAVKVMDFGIARAVADSSATVTQTANVIGTAQYLSPEQARGEAVDARSDVYSTGCLLYELVTGIPPFQGDSPVAVAYQHVRENPVMPSARKPDVPRVLDSIVMKALAKNPLNRYQSAADMQADLKRALANQPVAAEAVMTDAERTQFIARTPPPVTPPRRPDYAPEPEDNHRRNAVIWAVVVAALLLVIGVGAFVILHGGSGSGDGQVTVPDDLAGKTAAQAQQELESAGLQYQAGSAVKDKTSCVNQSVASGQVCTWSPTAGKLVPKNSVVTVSVYQEPSPNSVAIQLPDVTMKSYDQAVALLTAKGIDGSRIMRVPVNALDQNGQAVANEVISQSPVAYENLQPGGTVTLKVATGKIVLPDVTGKSQDDAEQAINAAGFTDVRPTQQIGTDKSKDGQVVQISPSPNVAYVPNTTITLTVYQYQAPQPSCSPSASSSASGSASSSPSGGASGSASASC